MSGGYSLNMDADLLIKEVYLRRPLWDRTNKQHGNRVLVNRLWEEVAQVVGAPNDAVKQKWKSLRATFRNELNKAPSGRENDPNLHPDDYLTNWGYFKSLFFLKNQVNRRRKFVQPSEPSEAADEVSEDDSEEHSNEYNEDAKQAMSNVETTLLELEPSSAINVYHFPAQSQNKGQQQYDHNHTDTQYHSHVPMKRSLDGNNVDYSMKRPAIVEYRRVDHADDDNYFFMSLLPYVKNMAASRKMLLRLKIQELVWKEVNNMDI